MTNAEAEKCLPELEKKYAEQQWEEYERMMKAKFLVELYKR
jgi:hypothetical protein